MACITCLACTLGHYGGSTQPLPHSKPILISNDGICIWNIELFVSIFSKNNGWKDQFSLKYYWLQYYSMEIKNHVGKPICDPFLVLNK